MLGEVKSLAGKEEREDQEARVNCGKMSRFQKGGGEGGGCIAKEWGE